MSQADKAGPSTDWSSSEDSEDSWSSGSEQYFSELDPLYQPGKTSSSGEFSNGNMVSKTDKCMKGKNTVVSMS